ncbi:reverse transcriptase [Tanacetum coccineum]
MWRALHNYVPSVENLEIRGLTLTSLNCIHCGEFGEDVMHILYKCSVAKEGLWTRRNKNFHGQHDERVQEVDAFVKQILAEYDMANQKDTSRAGTVQERQAFVWAKPQLDQVKVNCDASWSKESGKVGLGFVARNHNGEVLLSGARGECFASSPLEGEAKAILWAMSHARSRRYMNIVFESDSMCLVNALRNRFTLLQR